MKRDSLPACETLVDGNPDGPTLLFVHGWPDDARLWRRQIREFAADYLCIRVTLPNFGDRAVHAGGFDFPDLAEMLAATIETHTPEGRVTLITHDWGAYTGYLLERAYPERIERMVAMDVGGHIAPSSFKEKFFIVGYQWTLLLLWLIGGLIPPLGNWLTRWFGAVIGVPPRQRRQLRSRMNYPYFWIWRSALIPGLRHKMLSRCRPQCPVLFLWGKKKPVMFHSNYWLDIVAATGGKSVGIEDAGHWFMESHPEQVNALIREWLEPARRQDSAK